jgi:hypothetical protein
LARNNKTLAGRVEENRQMGDDLILRLSASRLDGPDYYDVLCDGEVVGSIHLRPLAPPPGRPWMWTLAYNHRREAPIFGFAVTLEAALTAFAKSWRREG